MLVGGRFGMALWFTKIKIFNAFIGIHVYTQLGYGNKQKK